MKKGQPNSVVFLFEIIRHTGGTQLANTQVAVICSKCVIWPWWLSFLAELTVLTLRHPLHFPSLSVLYQLSAGASPFEMVQKYAKQHNALLQSLALHPCVLQ